MRVEFVLQTTFIQVPVSSPIPKLLTALRLQQFQIPLPTPVQTFGPSSEGCHSLGVQLLCMPNGGVVQKGYVPFLGDGSHSPAVVQ